MLEFRLNDKEEESAKEFREEHKNCCKEKLSKEFFSTTGGEFSYIITPTGLGLCTIIRCNSCGEEEDITDIENWQYERINFKRDIRC